MLTPLEKKIIASLQGDIPIISRPFLELAKELGISEDQYLEVVASLNERGIIRRLGATLKHQNSGFKANAMVAWKVDEERVQEVGKIMASFEEVTHCYRRNPTPTWQYNLYTMVHGQDEHICYTITSRISEATGVKEYILLFSIKELKKTSMHYFNSLLFNSP